MADPSAAIGDSEQLATRFEDGPHDSPVVEKVTEQPKLDQGHVSDLDSKEELEAQISEHEEEIFLGSNDVVVIDNGSYMVKAGTADKKAPTIEWRCLVGENAKDTDSKEMVLLHDIDEGQEDDCIFKCPLDSFGRLQEKHVSNMGNLWHRILKKLYKQQDASELSVILTEPPNNLKGINEAQSVREKMMTLMNFNVGSCYIANDAQLALYSTGETSGTVVDMGHSMTYITPVYEGHVISHAVQMSTVAGKRANEVLKGHFPHPEWKKYINQKHLSLIKEKYCFTSPQKLVGSLATSANEDLAEENYKLPDNSHIKLKRHLLQEVPEIFFQSLTPMQGTDSLNKVKGSLPQVIAPDKSIKDLINVAVQNTPAKIRSKVSNVVLCGGSSMFQGMVPRFRTVLEEKSIATSNPEHDDDVSLKLVAKPYRKYATWIGGSILGSLEEFKSKWITQAIFKEDGGDRCVHKRVFW